MAPPTTRKETRDAAAGQSPARSKQSVSRAYARPKKKRRQQSPRKGGRGRTKKPREMGVPDDSEDEEDTEYKEDEEGKMLGTDKQQQQKNMVNNNNEKESDDDNEESVENQQDDNNDDEDMLNEESNDKVSSTEEQESPSKSRSSALTNEERLKILRKKRRESTNKEKMKDKKVRKVIRLLKDDYFRKVKFVSNDKEIKALMNAIKVDPKNNGIFDNLNEKEFESRYYPFVKQTMTTKRGTCAQEMGKIVKCKYIIGVHTSILDINCLLLITSNDQ